MLINRQLASCYEVLTGRYLILTHISELIGGT